jgi:hypothetical protein
MHDAKQMGFGEGFTDLKHEVDCVSDGVSPALVELVSERAAFEQFEHGEGATILEMTGIEHPYDVLSPQASGRPDFAYEPLGSALQPQGILRGAIA